MYTCIIDIFIFLKEKNFNLIFIFSYKKIMWILYKQPEKNQNYFKKHFLQIFTR